jgi:hypothetical protein
LAEDKKIIVFKHTHTHTLTTTMAYPALKKKQRLNAMTQAYYPSYLGERLRG